MTPLTFVLYTACFLYFCISALELRRISTLPPCPPPREGRRQPTKCYLSAVREVDRPWSTYEVELHLAGRGKEGDLPSGFGANNTPPSDDYNFPAVPACSFKYDVSSGSVVGGLGGKDPDTYLCSFSVPPHARLRDGEAGQLKGKVVVFYNAGSGRDDSASASASASVSSSPSAQRQSQTSLKRLKVMEQEVYLTELRVERRKGGVGGSVEYKNLLGVGGGDPAPSTGGSPAAASPPAFTSPSSRPAFDGTAAARLSEVEGGYQCGEGSAETGDPNAAGGKLPLPPGPVLPPPTTPFTTIPYYKYVYTPLLIRHVAAYSPSPRPVTSTLQGKYYLPKVYVDSITLRKSTFVQLGEEVARPPVSLRR